MFKSIVDDIKQSLQSGNMITKLMIVTTAISLFFILLKAILQNDPETQRTFISFFAIPGDPFTLLLRPWTVVTHMFVHDGFMHLLWNMLFLYWFGRIVGDLLGDKRILPIYLMSGFVGAFAYVFSYQLFPGLGSFALGASAAVMGIVVTAGAIAPEYIMRLILIGDVKLKFIVLFVLIIDLIGLAGNTNTGGHIAHLGGAAFGLFFVRQLKGGVDISEPMGQLLNRIFSLFKSSPASNTSTKTKLKVKYKSKRSSDSHSNQPPDLSFQEKLDAILDKIKENGYESLTDEEKEFLFHASKK